ncbi:S-layer homology domain-containing protein [Agathobaculum sp. LCP25S3_E8]|uniref:S-layer homology domain-containing protein n=1 Tax=Agathobaculum sp. LCP25S3_E8 TaxID=3438735 RepID=UPI003F91511A
MMHFKKTFFPIRKRACAFLLCLCMLLGFLPVFTPTAQAAESNYYLDRLVSWDIMRGDQYGNLEPNRSITRAEFVTMLNRTFGYTKTGAQPFRDVVTRDWYYDDISAAYTAGYFQGTSKSTASPNATLTREEAATMLCRNLMLQPVSGENLSFTDSRLASSWSRGYIKAAADEGILRGDPDGKFRPLDNITRGEVAIMLVRVIGTPIQDPGTYSTSVAGNLMVSCSGVTLENMTVTGDLYITGGVGLGYVTLNNVTVYGKIIASGAGESNKGDCSIILKNCTAPEMIVDSPSNQYVTIRTVGNTDIDKVYVRTDTYLEGKSTGRHGFQYIEVDGESGTRLDLAGNIHEVVTVAPESEINVGSGTVEKMTVDENAVDSTVTIAQGAVVEELNLDTGATVTGKGDIGTLNVNAPGCKVEMLPDDINIRPGITADINGMTMDSTLADQISDFPRILSGYPRMDDIAPTQAETSFTTNKPGTIYWAVRLSGDGPMAASDLIKPPTYGANIVKNGNLAVKDANEVLSQAINGLTIDTSYVLSAVLVDSRGDQSLVKSVYFTTPDNSKPDFASGYPKATTIEDTYVDFDVATTKTCTLYWAIYKKGMPAPTANDFKDGSLSGAIDSGSRKMIRSEEDSIRMGDVIETAKNALAELTDYDAYFFLTDSINDSSVKKVSITTADRTPPEFLNNYPRISKIDKTALTGEAAINEDGKVYWAIVKHGTDYPVENAALDDDTARELDQKLQIKGGMYALKSGSFNAKENTAASFNMSGLEAETAYDIYFVAEDNSGNLSAIKVLENAKTLDTNAPKLVELRFSEANDEGIPLADTDITLVFSEDIYSTQTKLSLVEMYESDKDTFDVAGSKDGETVTWSTVIDGMFTLNNLDITDPNKKVSLDLGSPTGKENMTVSLNEDGQTEVTFHNAALNLLSGTRYQFVLNFFTDSSNNNMGRDTKSDEFRIMDAQVDFNELETVTITEDDGSADGSPVSVDTTFSMIPYANSTANASDNTRYDVIIASDTTISFNLYQREHTTDDSVKWKKVNLTDPISIVNPPTEKWSGRSYNKDIAGWTEPEDYPVLQSLTTGYDYAIELTSINEITEKDKWDATVNLYLFCVAGSPSNLRNLVQGDVTESIWQQRVITDKTVSSIGNPSNFSIEIVRSNQSAPNFNQAYPRISPGDSLTTISYQLDRAGDVYYVVAPETNLPPKDGNTIIDKEYGKPWDTTPPQSSGILNLGKLNDTDAPNVLPSGPRNMNITSPNASQIMNPSQFTNDAGYRTGKATYSGAGTATIQIENLKANSKYYIYFVLKGSYALPSNVMCYKFSTTDVVSPNLKANAQNTNDVQYQVSSATSGTILIDTYWALYNANTNGHPSIFEQKITVNGKPMKILNAMKDDTFDLNADSDTKQQVWETLTGGGSGYLNSQSGQNLNVSAGAEWVPFQNFLDSEKLEYNNTYVFIVAAQNKQGGNPVFRSVQNIMRVDALGPRIENIRTPSSTGSSAHLYSGTITVTFDKKLYVRKSNGSKAAYPPGNTTDAYPLGEGWCYISKANLKSLSITCQNIPAGSMIEISPHGQDSADKDVSYPFLGENDYFSKLDPIRLLLNETVNEDGTSTFQFVISAPTQDCDGMTSEIIPS